MIGNRLRMISGRSRNHAARPFVGTELQQLVERAALLICGGELQVLELQPNFGADDVRQRSADEHRRSDDRALDTLGGGANVFDGWRYKHWRRRVAVHSRADNAMRRPCIRHL